MHGEAPAKNAGQLQRHYSSRRSPWRGGLPAARRASAKMHPVCRAGCLDRLRAWTWASGLEPDVFTATPCTSVSSQFARQSVLSYGPAHSEVAQDQ